MSGPIISYDPFDELVAELRADGLSQKAELLDSMIHKYRWTTGSELIGELGQEMKAIESEFSAMLSQKSKSKLEVAFAMVRRVWPDFPR